MSDSPHMLSIFRRRLRSAIRRSGVPRLVRQLELVFLRQWGVTTRRIAHRGRRPADPQAVRILVLTPTYLPVHRGGSEISLHAALSWLVGRGHPVCVVVRDGQGFPPSLDGVAISGASRRTSRRAARQADVIVGASSMRTEAMRLAALEGLPFVMFSQMGEPDRRALHGNPDLTVFSSEFLRSQYPWVSTALVLHPPIDPAEYRTTPGNAITLVNLSELKGSSVFFALARALPESHFLGVRGWGPQVVPPLLPSNVEILDGQSDMRIVYARTRIVLMPSLYETYGRVGLEAGVSGIPTIAHPAPGLVEALGEAAIWCDRADLDAWIDAIRLLDDPSSYEERSAAARARIDVLDSGGELEALAEAIVDLAVRGPVRGKGGQR